ncbi:RHS repeat domain-containing protein [Olleya namhaensis]|uniref:YD repeat-containing protein n=1 Tax=Olleya namhaensis TaxID=1144750 RepID=A0A1I3MTM3_9FLAO|nr:RHS repeat domain-containing protein [Olleya namhaensis]SFJ00368.1 YD repeat-containing protein [Olleya namhaensis]
MKNTILFFLMFFFADNVFSQELPNIVPPSPDVSALAQFTNVPVSHYTGLPDVSIPFFTIKQKGVTIPIGLSYHARGVKVSEIAPQTGMGWSLRYGGSVSRQVRGKPDDTGFQFGYFSNKNSFINFSSNENARDLVSSHEIMDSGYDFYPDQFSFDAGGSSGKFVFDYMDLKPVVQSFGDVKVACVRDDNGRGKIISFSIIDTKGNTYYYGISKDQLRFAYDYQTSTGKSIGVNTVVTDPISQTEVVYNSWKLMDVLTPYGELISYFYEPNTTSSYYNKSFDSHNASSANSVGNFSNINEIKTRLSSVVSYEQRLSRIEFNGGNDKIVFSKSSTLREDFNGFALAKVSLYNDNSLIKSFNLNYSYTQSSDETNLLWFFKSDNIEAQKYFKRMFLSEIQEEGIGGDKLPPFEFIYDSQVLPSIFSSRQDYWGYYNGATGNGPFTRLVNYGHYNVNRRVDTLKSEAGILKEIKYPTGGKAKFTYEHNIGRSYLASKLYLPYINPQSNDVSISLTKADFQYNNSSGYSPLSIPVPPSTNVSYRFQCLHLRDFDAPSDLPDCLFNFRVNNAGPYTNETININSGSNNSSIISVFAPNFPNVDRDLHRNRDYDFNIVITYSPIENDFLYGPGKRIKKIENISENSTVLIKEYEYVFSDDDQLGASAPSGAIIGFPAFINKANENDPTGVTLTKYYDASSAYSSFQPNTIGYSHVIEYLGTKSNNIGKTEYLFTNKSDSGGDYYEFPYHPPTDNEWLRGKPIRVKTFKTNQNSNYVLQSEVYNKYQYGGIEYNSDFEYSGNFQINGSQNQGFLFTPSGTEHDWNENIVNGYVKNTTLFKLPLFMNRRLYDGSNINNDSDWGYRIYHLTGGVLNLKRKVDKKYYQSGTFEMVTNYGYDYDKHYQVKDMEVKDSEDNFLKTIYFYPKDRDDISGLTPDAYNAAYFLSRENRFEILQTDVYKNSLELLSKQRVNFTKENNLILVNNIQNSKGDDPLQPRVVYHKYDLLGNPLELSKSDGTHQVYIWGYNGQFPIAKIENTTYSAIENLPSFGLDFEITENLSAIQEQELRSLSNTMVSTYTYRPLIGVTSVTDPRGNTIYYDYDGFNRLKQVKDKDDNILSKNDYNYANQN